MLAALLTTRALMGLLLKRGEESEILRLSFN
jgi:hypothetical protein